jgi:hypothetical protein
MDRGGRKVATIAATAHTISDADILCATRHLNRNFVVNTIAVVDK